MVSRRTLLAGAAVAAEATLTNPAPAQVAVAAVNIGSRRELLVDDHLIEKLTQARQVLHSPVPHEIALDHNVPWEGNTCTYHTVFRDGDRYRMYYRGSHFDESANKSGHAQVVGYAESADGIHWTRPELGLFEFEGSRKNNIVWVGPNAEHNFAPFRDLNPGARAEARYKAVGSGKGGLFAFQSPDGIHWSPLRPEPIITNGAFDSLNLAFWDTERRLYVDYHRKGRNGVRSIMTCTSPDFERWTEPEFLEFPGAPTEHLYTNAIQRYHRAPQLLIGFPKRYTPVRNPTMHSGEGVSDAVFMTSRDGRHFHRWTEAFVRPGLQPSRWVNRNNLPAWGMVETASDLTGAPPELSCYTTEGYYRGPSCRLRRHALRLDGFVSVQGSFAGGEVQTKPLLFQGENLHFNYSTSGAGSLRVEVQDAAGRALPGLSLQDSPEIFGDELDGKIILKQPLAPLQGKPIRLRIALRDADLYALRFG